MKLYATTTSDRKDAKSGHNISKGLGGNEYIHITLKDENQKPQYFILFNEYKLMVERLRDNKYLLNEDIPKGKQKKGDGINKCEHKDTTKTPHGKYCLNCHAYL